MVDTRVEKIDLLEQVIEATNDVEVALFEALVELRQLDRVVDHVIEAVAVLDILEVEEDLQILLLFGVSQTGFLNTDGLSIGSHELLDADHFAFLLLLQRRLVEKKDVRDVI